MKCIHCDYYDREYNICKDDDELFVDDTGLVICRYSEGAKKFSIETEKVEEYISPIKEYVEDDIIVADNTEIIDNIKILKNDKFF